MFRRSIVTRWAQRNRSLPGGLRIRPNPSGRGVVVDVDFRSPKGDPKDGR
jgi:hypothetical protein